MSAGAPGAGAAQLQADVAHMEKQCALLRRAPWLIKTIPLLTPRELDEHLRAAPAPAPDAPVPAQTPTVEEPVPSPAPVPVPVAVPPVALHELLPLVMGASGAEAAVAALAQLRAEHARAPPDRLSVLAAEAWLDDLVPDGDDGGCGDDTAVVRHTHPRVPQTVAEPIVLPPLRYLSTS